MSGDISRTQTLGRSIFFGAIEIIALIMAKNALFVFIHGLNAHLCSHLKNAILRELRKKNCGVLFHVLLMKCLSKCPYTKKASLPCEIPGRTPAFRFHSGQTN